MLRPQTLGTSFRSTCTMVHGGLVCFPTQRISKEGGLGSADTARLKQRTEASISENAGPYPFLSTEVSPTPSFMDKGPHRS